MNISCHERPNNSHNDTLHRLHNTCRTAWLADQAEFFKEPSHMQMVYHRSAEHTRKDPLPKRQMMGIRDNPVLVDAIQQVFAVDIHSD
jgi:hypothetical protein